jgi:hypothetical protein
MLNVHRTRSSLQHSKFQAILKQYLRRVNWQADKFLKAHATDNGNGGKAKADIAVYGQESNPTTWRLALMNLAIRGIEGDLGPENADTFLHAALDEFRSPRATVFDGIEECSRLCSAASGTDRHRQRAARHRQNLPRVA